jgi:outer membrane receptor for ferrienterochelin and colicins
MTQIPSKQFWYQPIHLFFGVILLVSALITFFAPSPVMAQKPEEKAHELGIITVTAPGSKEQVKDVEATVQVIGAEEIQATSRRSLAQIIQQATGFFVTDTGSTSSESLRGFNTGQALVLVDGMRRTGKYGRRDLTSIPLETIERIEIVRGPMSALYGADAMAGVINIVTKTASTDTSISAGILGGMAENGGRETGILRMTGNLGALGKTRHGLSAEVKQREDYKKNDEQRYTDLGEENRYALSYNGALDISEQQSLTWAAEWIDQDDEGKSSTASLGYPRTFEKETNQHLTGRYHHDLSSFMVDVSAGYGHTRAQVDRTSGIEKTDQDLFELNGFMTSTAFDTHTLILGTGGRHETMKMTLLSKSPERTVVHGLIQDSWQISPLISLMGGLRYDEYSDFGGTANPRVSATLTPGDFKFRAGFGTAFRTPTFIEQYGYFERSSGKTVSKVYGTANIDPETSRTFELAAAYYAKPFDLEIVYHHSDVEDLINSKLISTTGTPATGYTSISRYENISEAEISGIDATFNFRFNSSLTGQASWAFLEKEDGITGARLTGYARNTLKAGIGLNLGKVDLYATYRYFMDYYNTDWNLPRTASPVDSDFQSMDLKAVWTLNTHHSLSLGVDNVFNETTPGNFSRGAGPNDPGERYFYAEYSINF